MMAKRASVAREEAAHSAASGLADFPHADAASVELEIPVKAG
jgi:hypothetical protein